uniref:Uncharacterized protein n=1 Tax=Anguilla anguilla TaxID=7936 RepID=A0A0E9R367_ANGAN
MIAICRSWAGGMLSL